MATILVSSILFLQSPIEVELGALDIFFFSPNFFLCMNFFSKLNVDKKKVYERTSLFLVGVELGAPKTCRL